jgi:hypothetical protein
VTVDEVADPSIRVFCRQLYSWIRRVTRRDEAKPFRRSKSLQTAMSKLAAVTETRGKRSGFRDGGVAEW